jgi:hypothetical protein
MNSKNRKTATRRARLAVGRLAVEEARRQQAAEAAAEAARRQAEHERESAWVANIGAPAFSSIAELVAALEVDRDRLEELREARDGWEQETDEEGDPTGPATWAEAEPDDAEELEELEEAAGDTADQDEARERIQEDALSVQVRSGWTDPGDDLTAEEFELLLCTGGPAVRIIGDLDQHKQPTRARLQVQDWHKPWTEYMGADRDTLLTYAACFNFGE